MFSRFISKKCIKVRIVAGIYKSRRFKVPKSFKLRPTTDFAKENLFNFLVNYIDFENTIALDLFAGTGSISFELLSRGCKAVVCVEKAMIHCSFIKEVQLKLNENQLQIIQRDVFQFIKSCFNSFNFIFADPPYSLKQLSLIPSLILSSSFLLRKNGILVVEHSKEYDFSKLPYFRQQKVYGSVNFSIFHKSLNNYF